MGPALPLLLSAALAAPGAVVWTAPGADEAAARAVVAGLGVEVDRVLPLDDALALVRVVGVVDRAGDAACGGPFARDAWREELGRARLAVQLLDLDAALAAHARLELALACLREPAEPDDLLGWALGAGEAHLLAAQAPEFAREATFHRDEAHRDLALAATLLGRRPAPADLAPEAQLLLARAREEVGLAPAARVAVAGPDAARLLVDGRPARSGRLLPGLHLAQLVGEDDAVVAATLVRAEPGRGLLLWAEAGGRAPAPEELPGLVEALARTGSAHLALPALLEAGGDEVFLVTAHRGCLRAWAAEGGHVALRATSCPAPAAAPASTDASGRRYSFDLGASGAWMGGGPWPGGGFGMRVYGRRGLLARPRVDAVVDGAAEGWPRRGGALARLGLGWTGGAVDLALVGGVLVRGGAGAGPSADPVVGPSAGLALPPGGGAGLRLEAAALWMDEAGWGALGAVGLELR